MTLRTDLAGLFVALGLAAGVAAQAPPELEDVDRLGPQVGAVVPDFSLPDQNGRVQTLTSIMGPKGTMLVFFRATTW